jgi:hypothetical protein
MPHAARRIMINATEQVRDVGPSEFTGLFVERQRKPLAFGYGGVGAVRHGAEPRRSIRKSMKALTLGA